MNQSRLSLCPLSSTHDNELNKPLFNNKTVSGVNCELFDDQKVNNHVLDMCENSIRQKLYVNVGE